MPELPEVETVVRTLEKQIKDQEIIDIIVRYPKMIDGSVYDFKKRLIGQHFRAFHRRGKYIIFEMDDFLLISHLRMEGKYFIQDSREPMSHHVHVVFQFHQNKQLRYHDTRKFGRMEIMEKNADLSMFHNLGMEPFDETFNEHYVYEICKNKRVPLKTLLLNQSFVAGIGNIYADEILFACRLRPGKSCQRISHKDAANIVFYTREVLSQAILAGGTTIRSYTSSLGVTGLFQLDCKVHTKKICQSCHHEIKVKRIGGRSSYYCPNCQK